MQITISKANMLQHTATAVLIVTTFGTLCVPCPIQVFTVLSLLCALSLFWLQWMVNCLCTLHECSQADCWPAGSLRFSLVLWEQ